MSQLREDSITSTAHTRLGEAAAGPQAHPARPGPQDECPQPHISKASPAQGLDAERLIIIPSLRALPPPDLLDQSP